MVQGVWVGLWAAGSRALHFPRRCNPNWKVVAQFLLPPLWSYLYRGGLPAPPPAPPPNHVPGREALPDVPFALWSNAGSRSLFHSRSIFLFVSNSPSLPKPWFCHTRLELTSLEISFFLSSPCYFLRDGWERSFPHVCGFFPTQASRGFERAAAAGCWLQLPVPAGFREWGCSRSTLMALASMLRANHPESIIARSKPPRNTQRSTRPTVICTRTRTGAWETVAHKVRVCSSTERLEFI